MRHSVAFSVALWGGLWLCYALVLVFATRQIVDGTTFGIVCVWVAGLLANRSVTGLYRRWGWSQEHREVENISVPAPPVAPAVAPPHLPGDAGINTVGGMAVMCALLCGFLLLLSLVTWLIGVVETICFYLAAASGAVATLLGLPCYIARRNGTLPVSRVWVSESGVSSPLSAGQFLPWNDVAWCEVETKFGVMGQIETRTLTLSDAPRQNVVTLHDRWLRDRDLETVLPFVRWKLSQVELPSSVELPLAASEPSRLGMSVSEADVVTTGG